MPTSRSSSTSGPPGAAPAASSPRSSRAWATSTARGCRVAKVNTDENQQLAMRYSIFSIPTLIVFQNGREAARLVGYMPQEVMEERLSQFLA